MKRTPEKPSQVRAIPPRRNRIYKLLAVALPFLAVGLLELGLRVAGYGHPTGFFLEQEAAGKRILVDNPRFGWRFFPPALARTPQPLRISAEKPPGTVRIVVLGESAAMGDPEPDYGLPRQLEILLQAAYPSQKVEVINTAMTAINSHAILPIARDCARLHADYWVIYMGNNEVVGPFGAGTVFGPKVPSLRFIRASLWLKNLRTVQWMESLKNRLGGAPGSWQGMEMFLKQQVRAQDRQMEVVRRHFEANLKDILAEAKRAGAKPIVCSVVVNLKDCAPFASLHRPDLAPVDLAEFDKAVKEAAALMAVGSNSLAWNKLQWALTIDRTHAETLFRAGLCHLANGDIIPGGVIFSAGPEIRTYRQANHYFAQACTQDTLRFRADTQLNELLRQTCASRTNDGVCFVDTERVFAQASPNQIPGREVFWEHVHPNFEGNYLLAKSVAGQIEKLLTGSGVPSTPPALAAPVSAPQLRELTNQVALKIAPPQFNWLSVEETARRLAWTDWDHYQVADQVRKRLEQAPFTGQSNHDQQMRHLTELLARLQPQTKPAALKVRADAYRQAIAAQPEDWILHKRFGELLEAAGNYPEAEEQWQRVAALLPHQATALFKLGNLADKQGRSEAAITFFQQALQLQPGLVEALNGLGLCYLNQNRLADAVAQFEAALRKKPDFAAGHVNLALALAKQDKKGEAKNHYYAAMRVQTNYLAAYLGLGKLLKAEGRTAEALALYETAVRLRPEDALARFNLANTLADLQRHPEALSNYAATVAASPDFAEARLNYGLALARAGRDYEALEQFQAAATTHPDNADARLNFGVALARAKRLAEAREQFEAAVRLQPSNTAALVNLGMVLLLQNDAPGAIKSLEAALRLEPNNAAARKHLERARAAKGG